MQLARQLAYDLNNALLENKMESKNVSQILKGKSVLITRAAHQSKDLVKLVEKHGGIIAIAMPLIELVELEDKSEIYSAFEQLEHIDWFFYE